MRTLAALLATLVLAGAAPAPAEAHPLGNFTVNRYARIELARDGTTLRYILDLAEIPTLQELNEAGLPADATGAAARDALLAAKIAQLTDGAELRANGARLPLRVAGATLDLLEGQAGLATLRVELTLVGAPIADGARLEYRDASYPGRVGWHEVVIRGIDVGLAESTVPAEDRSNELRAYPSDPSVAPIDVSAARATVRYALAPSSSVADRIAGSLPAARFAVDAAADTLTTFLRSGSRGDAGALFAALLVAAALGALHALGPGHGKAVVGAYLVGVRGTPAHAVLLGLTVTATHTVGVYALALVTLVAARFVVPDRVYPILGALSGLLVVAIGVSLLRSRVAKLRAPGDHGHAHEHDGLAAHRHGGTEHTHAVPERVTLRGLLALGVSGGLLPCPTALVVLLAAVSFHDVPLGMALVAAFSVGLAAVLTAIGLSLVLGGRVLARSSAARAVGRSRLVRLLPAASALAITAAGALIAIDAARLLA